MCVLCECVRACVCVHVHVCVCMSMPVANVIIMHSELPLCVVDGCYRNPKF